MHKVEIEENRIFLDEKPFFPIGTAYYPRSTAYYLEEANFKEVEADFKNIKNLGYNIILIFVPWAEIESIKGQYRFEFLDKFIGLSEKVGIFILPVLLSVGIGWNYFPYWVRGGDIYENEEILKAEINLVKAIVRRYRDKECILIWDLALEMDTHVPPGTNGQYFEWLSRLYNVAKNEDKNHPITIGSYNEIRKNMPAVSRQAKIVDIVSTHSFPGFVKWSDLLRNERSSFRCSNFTSFLIKLNCSFKKPCLLGSFGMSTDFSEGILKEINYREESFVKKFIDVSFHCSLISKACGAIHYTFNDSIEEDILPFKINLFEGRFGSHYNNGKPKSIVDSINNFVKNFKKLCYGNLEFYNADAAILFNEDELYRSSNEYRLSIFNSYILSRKAGIETDFLDIKDVKEINKFKTIFVPIINRININEYQLEIIDNFIENGGHLYVSFDDVADGKTNEMKKILYLKKMYGESKECVPRIQESKTSSYDFDFFKKISFKNLINNNIVSYFKKNKGELLISNVPFEKIMGSINEIYDFEKYHKIYKKIAMADKNKIVSDNPNVEIANFKNRKEIILINHDYYNSQKVETIRSSEKIDIVLSPGEVLLID